MVPYQKSEPESPRLLDMGMKCDWQFIAYLWENGLRSRSITQDVYSSEDLNATLREAASRLRGDLSLILVGSNTCQDNLSQRTKNPPNFIRGECQVKLIVKNNSLNLS